jgi:hypothetical protein
VNKNTTTRQQPTTSPIALGVLRVATTRHANEAYRDDQNGECRRAKRVRDKHDAFRGDPHNDAPRTVQYDPRDDHVADQHAFPDDAQPACLDDAPLAAHLAVFQLSVFQFRAARPHNQPQWRVLPSPLLTQSTPRSRHVLALTFYLISESISLNFSLTPSWRTHFDKIYVT